MLILGSYVMPNWRCGWSSDARERSLPANMMIFLLLDHNSAVVFIINRWVYAELWGIWCSGLWKVMLLLAVVWWVLTKECILSEA